MGPIKKRLLRFKVLSPLNARDQILMGIWGVTFDKQKATLLPKLLMT